jgi:hypothetical protein
LVLLSLYAILAQTHVFEKVHKNFFDRQHLRDLEGFFFSVFAMTWQVIVVKLNEFTRVQIDQNDADAF